MQSSNEHFFEDDDRHRILEAIEEQAKSLSMARGAEQHRLSDWLNAAEEVMPEVKKPTVRTMSMGGTEVKKSASNLVSVLIGGTLLLTLAGLGGFAVFTLNQQLESLKQDNQQLHAQLATLEEAQQTLAKDKASAASETPVAVPTTASAAPSANNAPEVTASAVEKLLDSRFEQLIHVLEQRAQPAPVAAMPTPPSPQTQVQVQAIPQPPTTMQTQPLATVTQPAAGTLTQTPAQTLATATPPTPPAAPAVAAVTEASTVPTVGEAAAKIDHPNYWLFALPDNMLILQLGSSVKADGFADMIKKIRHEPELAHVLTVAANGSKRYVLAYGAFASKEEAKKAADQIKLDVGVTPWIRKVADVQKLAEKP